MTLYQEKTGVEKLFIDWSNSTVREGAATPESQRKLGAIPATIAKNTVCKKFKVFENNWQSDVNQLSLISFNDAHHF